MFGIGTTEMLVIGLVAIVWLALKGRAGAAMIVLAGLGLLTALVVAGIIYSWCGSRVVPGVVDSAQIAPDGTQYWVSDQISRSGWTHGSGQNWPGNSLSASPVNGGNTTWSIALRPMSFMIVAFIAILAVAAHRGVGHAFAGGHGHIWPVLLVVPIIAFLMLGGIRYKSYQSASEFNAAQQNAQQRAAEQHERWAAAQVEQANAYQKQLGEQAKQLAAKLEEAVKSATISQHINHADIHQLMDEFDAPRIVLQVPLTPSAAPAAFIIAAAASATKEAAEAAATKEAAEVSANKEAAEAAAKKEAVAKTVAPKIKLKSAADGDKHAAAVELRVESSSDAEPDEPDDASIATEAEAPQPPVPPVPPVAPVPVPPVPTVQSGPKPKPPSVEHEPRVVKSGTTPPAWINDPPKRTGDVRREVIATEDYESAEECYAAADIYLMIRTYERLQQIRGVPAGVTRLPSITFHPDEISADGRMIAMGNPPANWTDPRFAQLSQMGIGAEFLRREIVAKDPDSSDSREYLETVTRSVGPMKKLYMQVEFTPAIDRELMRFAEAYSRQERFAAVGFGAGSVLTLLTMVWGLLKIDTATKGYYTKRLFLGVPAAIIAGVIAVITWMNYHL